MAWAARRHPQAGARRPGSDAGGDRRRPTAARAAAAFAFALALAVAVAVGTVALATPSAGAAPATPAAAGAGCALGADPAPQLLATPDPLAPEYGRDLADQAEATPMPVAALPSGPPAAPAAVAGARATLEQVVACIAAGDRDRLFSLFSGDFPPVKLVTLGLYYPWYADPAAIPTATALAEPDALPPFAETRQLADGRVVVVIPGAAGVPSVALYFVEDDGRWLIDDVAEVAP